MRKLAAVIGVLAVGMYVLLFVVPRRIDFSYAGDTCVGQLTLFPDVQHTIGTNNFSVSHHGGFSLGRTRVLATQTCFKPELTPHEGSESIASAPWGWYVFRTHYVVSIPGAPQVSAAKLTAPIASTKSLTYAINQMDAIFTYILSSDKKESVCTVRESGISCNLAPLALTQGANHTVALSRKFGTTTTRTTVTTTNITILPAVQITGSSPQPNQIIYDIPKTFTVTTDKPVVKASAQLVQLDGDKQAPIALTTTVADKTITLAFASDLTREKSYKLVVQGVEANDGSTTNEPYVVNFSTSGGPKVSGINIGASGIDQNARIVVTLDQPIASSVDIAKFASISGTGATITKQNNTIVFQLHSVPRCTAFTLIVNKGIESATNGLLSKNNWSYTSRVNCRATAVIGYSVNGRPITAFYYGSGATTILFTGGMHGSEPSGMQTMQAWANYLDSNADKIPAGRQVVIVPNTNPDGIAKNSRYNVRGVNIDRNFATSDWKADIDTSSGTLAGGGGTSPMSEPETQAIGALTLQLNPRLEVSYHAAGRLVGANDIADSRSIGTIYASMVGYSTMFGGSAEEIMGYGFSGQYEDYIGQKLGKPAILIELPTASGNYLGSQLDALWKMVSI